jgi:aminoglycoside phosphotransferase (APT) family kinase protein
VNTSFAASAERTSGPVDNRQRPFSFPALLQRLIDESDTYFGGPVSIRAAGELRRPFSTILRVRVRREDADEGNSLTAFIKVLKPRAESAEQVASMRRNVVREFEVMSQVQSAVAGVAGLRAVHPIACFPEDLAIVTQQAEGQTLSGLLPRMSRGWPADHTVARLRRVFEGVSGWLHAVQSRIAVEDPAPYASSDWHRDYLDRRFAQIQAQPIFGLTRLGRKALEAYRDRLLQQIDERDFRPAWIHADFCPENIVVDDRADTITVLDFTMAKSGVIYHDLAHLHMQLGVMTVKPWFRRGTITRLQDALLESFEPGLRPDRPLFALASLEHVICHLLSLGTGGDGALSSFYESRVRRRHVEWLIGAAGLPDGSWTR